MAKYLNIANEVGKKLDELESLHELTPAAKQAVAELIFDALKGMPHIGANYKLKVNFMREMLRVTNGLKAVSMQIPSRDGVGTFETVGVERESAADLLRG